jgi:hypothetical protein
MYCRGYVGFIMDKVALWQVFSEYTVVALCLRWLRHYATSRKVSGLIPDKIIQSLN